MMSIKMNNGDEYGQQNSNNMGNGGHDGVNDDDVNMDEANMMQ